MKTNPVFEQALIQLARARDAYQHALSGIDGMLAVVISRDPSLLEEVRDIQASYVDDITVRELAAAEQPAAPEVIDGAKPDAGKPAKAPKAPKKK